MIPAGVGMSGAVLELAISSNDRLFYYYTQTENVKHFA
jgi:hypothetical protein